MIDIIDSITGEDQAWVYGERRQGGVLLTRWMQPKPSPAVDTFSPAHQRDIAEAGCRLFHKAHAHWAERGRDLGRCDHCGQ